MNARRSSAGNGRRRSSSGGGGASNSSDDDDDAPKEVRSGTRRLSNFGNNNAHQPGSARRGSSMNTSGSSGDDIDGNYPPEKGGGLQGGANAIGALTRGVAGGLAGAAGGLAGAVSGVTKVTTGAVTGVTKAVTTGAVSGVTTAVTGVGKVATGTVGAATGTVTKTFNIIRRGGGRVGGQGSEDEDDIPRNRRSSIRETSKSTHRGRRTSNDHMVETADDDDDDDNDGKKKRLDDVEDDDDIEYAKEAERQAKQQQGSMTGEGNDTKDTSRISKKANEAFARRAGRSSMVASGGGGGGGGTTGKIVDTNILDKLPIEYRYNPRTATPVLHYLPRLMAAVAARDSQEPIQLRSLLKAAAGDIRLHRARVQAALERDMKLIRTYQLEYDPRYKERVIRLQERKEMITELKNDKEQILKDLKEGSALSRGLTQSEAAQLQLVRWQRALELYVHDTSKDHLDDMDDYDYTAATTTGSDILNWQSVFEKLLDGISEDQDISQILQQASEMCSKLVRETEKSVEDAAQYLADLESAYVIRLEGHEMFARSCLQQVANIEEQFRTAGQAALRIGHQLENAELKRSQCESASILIRRWWIMESLAEQEASTGEPIPVEMEMNGGITPNACRLDHLFTKRENSLEASKALKQLRAVVRSRGNAAAAGSATSAAGAAMIIDKSGSKRLDLTSDLITRVSDALEERLLNQFSIVYTAGGNYDFSIKSRPGAIDWRELRSLAQALLLFDSGRNLHKRYVEMVLENRFPEFASSSLTSTNINNKKKNKDATDEELIASSMKDANLTTFDMDATRTKLSQLFHRVSEVCTAEFELIAHVFSSTSDAAGAGSSRTDVLDGNEEMPLVVARALLQRVISDPQQGLQARVNDLLASIDRQGDFDSGAKKLDTFVVIHEKAAGLFSSLRDAADRMMLTADDTGAPGGGQGGTGESTSSALAAVESLKGFLTSQELALGNQHRQSYINLELRLLHHDCCACLDQAGCTLVKGTPPRPDKSLAEKGILEEYRAPLLPLHKQSLEKSGFPGILTKPLKPSVLRQPLIHATDALARARLMFGTSLRGGETTARVILSIYNQMCCFYGQSFLYPILETIREMLPSSAPSALPQLPFNEDEDAHDLGVSPGFWVAMERIHSAAKSFDRELWGEPNAAGTTSSSAAAASSSSTSNHRVWETLEECGDKVSLAFARSERSVFYSELERRGESAILRALDTISTHVQWIVVTGGESMLATGASRMLGGLTGGSTGGPYAIPAGSSLETPNSPAVKSLSYCLRVQFVHIQAALTPQSLANFWTALSMRLYDILVARLLQHYYISTVGAVILSRDVDALRSVAMLSGSEHSHWDVLRELLTLYMTPPDAIKSLLTGPSESEVSKGLFSKYGKDKCIVFLSRRNDYRYKTTSGLKKSGWVVEMLNDLHVTDPTDGKINIGLFAAGRKN